MVTSENTKNKHTIKFLEFKTMLTIRSRTQSTTYLLPTDLQTNLLSNINKNLDKTPSLPAPRNIIYERQDLGLTQIMYPIRPEETDQQQGVFRRTLKINRIRQMVSSSWPGCEPSEPHDLSRVGRWIDLLRLSVRV